MPGADADEGLTLIEVIVAMAVMAVIMSISTAGMLQVYRSANATQARSITQSQIQNALLRLDKQIRYANGITTAARVGSIWYAEYLNQRTDPVTGAATWTCHALRLKGTNLETLSWDKNSVPDPAKFSVLITGVTALDATAGPFPAPVAVPTGNDLQRLRISLRVSAGGAADRTTETFDVTFAALNSSATDIDGGSTDTVSPTVCESERR